MKAELQLLGGQILAAGFNGVYQGILVTVVAGVMLRWLRTNAATRHACWLAILVLLVLALPAHYWLDRSAREVGPLPQGFSNPQQATDRPMPFTPSLPDAVSLGDDIARLDALEGFAKPLPVSGAVEEDPAISAIQAQPLVGSAVGRSSRTSFLFLARSCLKATFRRLLRPIRWNVADAPGFWIVAAAAGLWLAVALFHWARLARRLLHLKRLRRESTRATPELEQLFARLLQEGRGGRTAELRLSSRNRCPVVLGFARPIILLPAELAVGVDLNETEHVLRHELAHVRRYDDWVNLLQHVIQSIFFFQPAVWWVSKQLCLEREIACDDYVLQHARKPRQYALVLTSVASRIHQPTPLLAPGVSNSKSQLQQRINMILNTRRNASPRLAKARLLSVLSAASLAAFLALCAGPRFVLAQSPAAPTAAVTSAGLDTAPSAVAVSPAAIPGTAGLAQADSADASPAVEPGPKFKPEQELAEPGVASAPEPPAAMPSPQVTRVSKPRKVPQPPDSPEFDNDGNASVEARLRRLEKMVKELMAQQTPKHARPFVFKDGNDNFNMDQQSMDKMNESMQRQVQRSADQAKRAAEQAKRATKDLQARLEQDQEGRGQFHEALQQQLEALRKAREGLGREMERLDRQIEKLQQKQQEHDGKDGQSRSDVFAPKLQADAEPAPEVNR